MLFPCTDSRGRVGAVIEAGVVELVVDGVEQGVRSPTTHRPSEVVLVQGPEHHPAIALLLDVAYLAVRW